jgi:hypothetical protein
MAKVTGPLHSLTAQGDFGKILTYRRVGQNNVVSEYFAPNDQNSNAQIARACATHVKRGEIYLIPKKRNGTTKQSTYQEHLDTICSSNHIFKIISLS